MQNEKQLVLFFEKNTSFDQMELAKKLKEKFSELGEPTILPINEADRSQPLIIFNQKIINVTINYNDISFVYYEKDKEEYSKLAMRVLEYFIDSSYRFVRMGYVSTYFGDEKVMKKFKKTVLATNAVSDDFQLAWYNKITIDSVLVNVWERHLTDYPNKVDFVSIFDINTPFEEEYNINSDFIEVFLIKCDKYIENKIDEIL